jgi:hypothetical protein
VNRIIDLQTALLDLLQKVNDSDVRLIAGGGFGIYLKTDYVRKSGMRTLLDQWPEPRSTNDLDLFLRPELLIEPSKLKPLASAIAELGYEVVPGAEKYQFAKPGPDGTDVGGIKIDILTGPQSRFNGTRVKADTRRARPKPSVGIHAHPVDEALTLEEGLLSIVLKGALSSGETWKSEIFLPHPYTFSMMKLFAFRDRLDDPYKEYGRYHALDLYTILATATEEEWEYALQLRDQYKKDPFNIEASHLVYEYFSTPERLGMIRLRESPYFRPELQIEKFMSALQELFPVWAESSHGLAE